MFAKKFGVYVYEFSIGMGPRLFKFKRKNDETEYSIRLLPIGGYVQMAGESVEVDEKIPKEQNLQSKPAYQRFLIMVAGVMMNFLLAIFVYFIIGMTNTVTFNNVYIDLPAINNLDKGDKIISIDGAFVNNYDKLALELTLKEDKEFIMGVRQENGDTKDIIVKPIKVGKSNLIYGIDYGFSVDNVTIASTNSEFLEKGDIISKVNGIEITNYNELLVVLNDIKGKEISLTLKGKDNVDKELKITPAKIEDELIGYAYGFNITGNEEKGFIAGIKYGFFKFFSTIEQMFFTILYLCTGEISMELLSGPVGVYNIVSIYSAYGFMKLLSLLALICVNVGFINILPLPAMDGGHILFIIIEKIRGKRIDPKIENTIHNIGLILLLILMVVITYNDITRLF